MYQPGPAGLLWLNPQAVLARNGRTERWLEPLLAAELLVRLVEGEGKVAWRGPAATQADFKLEVPAAGAARWPAGEVIFFIAGLVQRSLDWAGLVRAFDQAARRQPLPPVALLLPDNAQVALVSDIILNRRLGPVGYLLAAWPRLAGAPRLATAPCWRYLPPDGEPRPDRSLNEAASG